MRPLIILLTLLLSSARAAEPVRSYDLVVIGGTPGGIACAVRAAREGLSVVLVNRHDHLGGIMSSGLGVWDTLHEGKRSPIYDEVRQAIFDHYRTTYGADSPQYRDALPGKSGHTNGRYEPHVAEKVFEDLAAREKRIAVLKGFVPVAAEREGALVKSVTIRAFRGDETRLLRGEIFADCTYEGDLAALAKVPYRVAREPRDEFGEPHAGIVFMRPVSQPPDAEAAQLAASHDKLNLRKFPGWQIRLPESTGAADDAVQACNYRTILTTNPANRVPISQPANYDPYFLKTLEVFSGVKSIPGDKFGWNRPQLVGRQTAYVEADWDTRQRIMDEHWETTLGLLYFLQHDPTVPEKVRAAWLDYGLARDEFTDNGHRPYEIYVREARRIRGRAIYTQHDAMLAAGLARAPVHADSIAVTEWYMDSHSCTLARVPGSMEEGKAMLHQETFPGQIPYRCLLPQGTDNLLVPVCLSATHVAWGTVRLEPVFMQSGESAGFAAALAMRNSLTPAALDPDSLVRALVKNHMMVSFFNDVDVSSGDPRVAAAQYFGTKGFFASYDARIGEALTESVRRAWDAGLTALRAGKLDPMELARLVHQAEKEQSPHLERARGEALLSMWRSVSSTSAKPATPDPSSPPSARKSLKVRPARSAGAHEVNGKSYDLVVIGGTPGGIACAVRAAREGLSVLLTQHNRHIGGMLANGLMQWDALYGGPRSPIFDEYAAMIGGHYRDTYGENSAQYAQARYAQTHYPMSRFEPGVAEHLFNRLVSAEKNITALLSHYPLNITRKGALLQTLTLREYGTTNDIRVTGGIFADATYEGDLAALAKVPYRVGREGREEYGEPHAGKIFTNILRELGPKDVLEGKLNLHSYAHKQGTIDPTSPQTADRAIQAYNHRFCLTDEDGNRRLPDKPPGYKREEYVGYNRLGMGAGNLNGKGLFNSALLPGENHNYPEADWPTREKIIGRHKNFALGLMWFLQNDGSVPPAKREAYRRIGLPIDEFPDNDNLPYELYVREARRIVGRHVFTEHDNRPAPGIGRTPVHPDSIAITDWPMDSHDCTWDRSPGYAHDGKLILTEESRPAQVPYRSLLPQGIDNLLVPVCLSATHVAWGAVRLEPVWMQTGEAAGFAAALARKQKTTPAKLDADLLVRTLIARGQLVSFFNDLSVADRQPWAAAAQYFGTKGFFADYDVNPDAPLSKATAKIWSGGLAKLRAGALDPNALARALADADRAGATPITEAEFDAMLSAGQAARGRAALHRPAAEIPQDERMAETSKTSITVSREALWSAGRPRTAFYPDRLASGPSSINSERRAPHESAAPGPPFTRRAALEMMWRAIP